MASDNFPINCPAIWQPTATTTSQRQQIDPRGAWPDVFIYNPGPNIVRVRSGNASVTADATSMPILAGEKGAYTKGTDTHLAVISPDGNQAIEVYIGSGS